MIRSPFSWIAAGLFIAPALFAQKGKPLALPATFEPAPAASEEIFRPEARRAVPAAEIPFGNITASFGTLSRQISRQQVNISIVRDEYGTPLFFKGVTDASTIAAATTPEQSALAYWTSLQPEGITAPAQEFRPVRTVVDEQNNYHIRLEQHWMDIPIYGGEVIVHSFNGHFNAANGRYVPSPQGVTVVPAVTKDRAVDIVKSHLGADRVKKAWTSEELQIIGTETPFEATLMLYAGNGKALDLTWHIVAHPNLLRRYEYFVNARSGAVVHYHDHTCHLHRHPEPASPSVLDGSVTASGIDLLGVNRSFGAWQANNKYYLEDATQTMFNPSSSMPDMPIGAIVTLDAKNTTPANDATFDFDYVTSNTAVFNNTAGVSAHWNTIKSYEYFKNKFNRNSIDGNGGNIIAFINVAEDDGSSMENAFWNGGAMWYGNGGLTFKKLARALDVGGHEMSHGVIEKTANLNYQGESGALNESFADIFGAMIDSDDWQIGEDVMQPNTHTCLRDLSNPHNGFSSSSSPYWQPAHVSEKYSGTQDNGGVHINSGISNKAYYLFATASGVGKDKAEQVYYKALRDYLVKSSQFVDCRIAVIQAANDLYGSAVANAAAAAFDAVGIGGSTPGGNYLGQLSPNPGTELMLCTADDDSSIALADAAGNLLGTVYNDQYVLSRPSITDDGTEMVFVSNDGHIRMITFSYNGTQINASDAVQLTETPSWRTAAISKDGRFIAFLSATLNNDLYIYDRATGNSRTFPLTSGTYTQGQTVNSVQYADVLEFDYSGQYIVFDALNELNSPTTGQELSYWNIGLLHFWENGAFRDETAGNTGNLFSGIEENVSIGNPVFAKNAPYILAFDFYDGNTEVNDIYGVNTETGDIGVLASDIGGYGWPNYNKSDNAIVFHSPSLFLGADIYRRSIQSDKINGQGNYNVVTNQYYLGVLFANGNRSLQVDAEQPAVEKSKLTLFPNPAHTVTTLQFEMPEAAPVQVVLSGLLGEQILAKTVDAAQGVNYIDIWTGDLPAGTYFVSLVYGSKVHTVKMLKY